MTRVSTTQHTHHNTFLSLGQDISIITSSISPEVLTDLNASEGQAFRLSQLHLCLPTEKGAPDILKLSTEAGFPKVTDKTFCLRASPETSTASSSTLALQRKCCYVSITSIQSVGARPRDPFARLTLASPTLRSLFHWRTLQLLGSISPHRHGAH